MNPGGTPGRKHKVKINHVFGIPISNLTYNSTEICGKKGLYQVHTYVNLLDGFVAILTLGGFSATTLDIICDDSDRRNNNK